MPTNAHLLSPLTRCWACDGNTLAPAHRERLEPGLVAKQPGGAEVLGPYVGLTFSMNRCRACGFMQPEGVPSHPLYFEALYDQKWGTDWMAGEFEATYKNLIFKTILARLGRVVCSSDRSLLDVGTGVGRMIHLAGLAGWRTEGIELNRQYAEFAADRTGRPIHRTAAALTETCGRFDAVVLTDVLEHIPDPVAVLGNLRRLVSPGGWIAIKVPHGPNQRKKQLIRHWFDATTITDITGSLSHINNFTAPALRTALQRAGFGPAQVTVGAPELFPGDGWKARLSRLGRRAVYHLARLCPGGTRTLLALNLQAYAQNLQPG